MLGRACGAIRFEKVWFTYDGTERPALRGRGPAPVTRGRGQRSRSSGRAVPGSRRSRSSSCAATTPTGAASRSTGSTCASWHSPITENISTVLQETLRLRRHGRREHQVGQARFQDAGGGARGGPSRRRPPVHRAARPRLRHAGRPARGGCSPAASASGWRSPGPSSGMRRCCSSTSRPPGWTPRRGERVLAPLRRLMAGRTTIIISHDLHTVTDADEIVVLDGGAVSAVGRHEELLATSPIYAHLYALHQAPNRIAAAPAAAPPAAARPTGPAPARTRPRPRRGRARRGGGRRHYADLDGAQGAASARSRRTLPPVGVPSVAATTPLRAATGGRHALPQSRPDAPATQRPPRHALAEAIPPAPPLTMPLRAIGSAPVTAPGLAHQLPGPRAPHDVPS